jgi:hypothetical protein
LVTELWKRHLRHEALHDHDATEGMSAEAQAKLVEELRAFTKGASLPPGKEVLDDDAIEAVSTEHRVSKRKGSWWRLPKDSQDEAPV